jgi:hypothetical protein
MFGIKSKLKKYIDGLVLTSLSKPAHPAMDILLSQHGYAYSIESKVPLAADGSPIPWYTYPAIEYFNQLNAKGLRIFEYGSGNSSIYWARKGANVWSVEHDSEWYKIMTSRAAQLKGLLFRESKREYAESINDVDGEFDVIVIDGAWRNECAAASLSRIKKGGLIILDNSDWYTDVSEFLKGEGFFQVDFNGFGPINNYCWTTSIFFPFDSSVSHLFGHPSPVGGIDVYKGDKW